MCFSHNTNSNIKMFPQTPCISLFIVLSSLVLCHGYYIEESLYKTNYKHYPMHGGRFMKRRHDHFGLRTRANRVTPLSSRPRGTVNVDDFGAEADGRDNTEVTYHVINKKRKKISYVTLVHSQSLSSFCYLFFLLFRHLERHGVKHVQEGQPLWYQKIGSIVLSQSHFLVHVDPTLPLW